MIALILTFVVGIMVFVFSMLKNSGAYENAMEVASGHPTVIEIVGEPIEADWFVMGNVQITNQTGNADLSIPISGPAGEGRIHVVATKNAGVWYFDTLTFSDSAGGPPISLLEEL